MLRRSWFTLAGSVVLVAALAVGFANRSAAQAVGPPTADAAALQLADLPACGPVAGRAAARGSSWSAREILDRTGTLAGWMLVVDTPGAPPLGIQLPPESSVSEPIDDRAVVTADDGTSSLVVVITALEGCATRVARLDAVARSGILRGRDGSVWLHAVDRSSRRDLGVWSVISPGDDPELVTAPLAADDPAVLAVGRVFATGLRLDTDGDRLAVQSCGERACRTRVVDLGTGREWRIDGPHQGPLVAFGSGRATFRDACPDAPCPVRDVVFDPTVFPPETESPR